jgi:hypothetical protein
MERRTFLSLCTGTLALGTTTGLGVGAHSPFCHVSGENVFPGAPLHVDLDSSLAAGARLHLSVRHAGGQHLAASVDVHGGQRVTLETPYPHSDLVAGEYLVRLDLHARGGRLLQTVDVGTYRVVPFRFSV